MKEFIYIGPTTVPIRGQEGYFISLDCSVWSFASTGPKVAGKVGKFRKLTPRPGRRGYMCVYLTLANAEGRRERTVQISRLMLSSFVRAPVGNEEADHIDSTQKDNNTLDNLQWLSPAENLAKRKLPVGKDHWMHKYPEKCPQGCDTGAAKLTQEQVDYCRAKYIPKKYTLKMLAKELGVCRSTVGNAINRNTYK